MCSCTGRMRCKYTDLYSCQVHKLALFLFLLWRNQMRQLLSSQAWAQAVRALPLGHGLGAEQPPPHQETQLGWEPWRDPATSSAALPGETRGHGVSPEV